MADEKKKVEEVKVEKEEKVVAKNEMTIQDTMKLGSALAKSRRFADIANSDQALVQILAGRELGIGPIAAMTKIHIIKGKVSISAEIMAGQIKKSGKYNYRVSELTNEKCAIIFSENGTEIGESTFTLDDARKALVAKADSGWGKYPRNMLFARAMSNGCRWYCPDVIFGAYVPEEMGIVMGDKAEVIEGEIVKTEAVESTGLTQPQKKKIITELLASHGKEKLKKIKEDMKIGIRLVELEDDVFKEYVANVEKAAE